MKNCGRIFGIEELFIRQLMLFIISPMQISSFVKSTEELERLINFYDGDLEKFNLKSQLQLLYQIGVKFFENNYHNTRCYYTNEKAAKSK